MTSRRDKTPGKKVGTKQKDTRWRAPDGVVWASRFEYQVYAAIKEQLKDTHDVHKCTPEQDSMAYTSPIRNGYCIQCASERVATRRSYTPDVHVVPKGLVGRAKPKGYYIEAKGYIRAPRRKLLRDFRKAQPDVDLRLIFQRNYPVGKSGVMEWAKKYLKVPAFVWHGKLPKGWI